MSPPLRPKLSSFLTIFLKLFVRFLFEFWIFFSIDTLHLLSETQKNVFIIIYF